MKELKIKGIYKHFKGNYYLVEDIVTNCDNDLEYVLYRTLYGESKLYVRKYEEFMSEVDHEKYPDVKQKYRFELQNIESVNFKR